MTSRFQHGASAQFSQSVRPLTVSALRSMTESSSRTTAGTPPASKKSSIRNRPDGCRSTRHGNALASVSKSASVSGTPIRPAMAIRCSTALVDPPIPANTRIAFSNAARVRICDMRKSCLTISTARRPAWRARTLRRPSTAGIAALPGKPMPSASTIEAIVLAVPMVMQCPCERCIQLSASTNSSCDIRPPRTSSDICQTPVPEPIACPRQRPVSIGPPETPIAGRSTEAAPIKSAGVVLSHPINSTTPSNGLARIDSSTSIDARLRYSMAVGRIRVSPSDITGNSSGKPPASQTPILTCSASVRKCELHGVSSL